MTKINDLRKGDIVRLENGHEAWVQHVGNVIPIEREDVAKVYVIDIGQQGLLYDRDNWERVVDYSVE